MAHPLLSITDLHFAYHPAKPLLQGCTWQLEPAQRWLIAGPNGSGKSTLLRLLMGLLPWQQGLYHLAGRHITSAADHPWIWRQAGYLSQHADNHLFCPTVGDDCRFGPLNYGLSDKQAQARAEHYLCMLGIESLIDEPCSQLSGGQRQLAAIAAILCCEPAILLLDEPSNTLDSQASTGLQKALVSLPHAMVIISHDPSFTASVATHTADLIDGQLQPR